MKTFEQYWEANQDMYKQKAQQDFEKIQKGQFVAHIIIDTDDDFYLDIENEFDVHGDTLKDLQKNIKSTLNNAQFTYVKKWAMEKDGVRTSGDYADRWYEVRDYVLKQVDSGKTNILYGGNQSMGIVIEDQLKPIVEENNKLLKKNKMR